MKIVDAIFVAANAGFYFDDQQAIKQGAQKNGFVYEGAAITDGFSSIRQSGECISIMLVLENGQVAKGDCVAVQYSGAGGRDPLFVSQDFIPILETYIRPLLVGLNANTFLSHTQFFDGMMVEGRPLHTAIRYGLSQALLEATAIANRCLKMEVICNEYDLPVVKQPVALFGQSGDDRYDAVDKMIIKKVGVLPHGLINCISDKLGSKGELLLDYVKWLRRRILRLRQSNQYCPDLHIDVYGTMGMIFDNDFSKIAHYIHLLQEKAKPFTLYIEGPVDMGSRDAQIEALAEIKKHLSRLGSRAKIVADEWCNTYDDIVAFANAYCCDMIQIKTPDLGSLHNTVEAILYCKNRSIEAYQGGTCNETDISAQSCVHVALACRPKVMLAKPGMGFDEGMMIVNNEMRRTLEQLKYEESKNKPEPVKAMPYVAAFY
jgi:methylaspartate ammonia-lyase